MPRFYRYLASIFLAVLLLFGGVWLGSRLHWPALDQVADYLASLAYPETITPEYLANRYRTPGPAGRVSILLVPGHDNDYSGAQFGTLREADLNLALAKSLFGQLSSDTHFSVFTTRDFDTGEYVADLANYFVRESESIRAFREDLQARFRAYVRAGNLMRQTDGVSHNFAPQEVSLRLYGINKWANERGIDVVLHIHFNDYPRRRYTERGVYSGFAVYVPENQYPNARASRVLAEAVYQQLTKYFAVSDLPVENSGVVEDQDLIAIGAQGSRVGTSFLIEYGYIYESQWIATEVRERILPELALQTYLGLKNYFEPDSTLAERTLLLPHRFARDLAEGARGDADVLALQKALQHTGFYPPPGRSLNACPVNGNFGPCVRAAVRAFQTANAISATGYVGELTIKKLNELFAG